MYELMEQYLSEASAQYDLNTMKVNMFTEAAERQLYINRNAAELKVLQENGTDDDLRYLFEEADSNFVDAIVKAIKKLRDDLLKFISEMKDKILDMVTDAKQSAIIADIKKKVKLFPLIGQKKIVVENYEAEKKAADDHIGMLTKIKAKLKAGQDVEVEEVNKIEKSFMEVHGKLLGIGEAFSVTVSKALDMMTETASKAKSSLDSVSTKIKDFCNDAVETAKNGKGDPRVAQSLARAAASINHTIVEDFVRFLTNLRRKISEAIKTMSSKLKKGDKVEEATEDAAIAAAEQASKNPNDTAPTATEDGGTDLPEEAATEGSDEDDPIPSPDEEPDADPWDDVMRTDDETIDDAIDLDDDGEGDVPDIDDMSFESVFDSLLEDLNINESSDKPNSEKVIKDLYSEIEADVKGKGKKSVNKNPNPEPAEPLTESTYDMLLNEIESLF